MKLDLKKFIGKLPYSSELFGVYSSMIGWQSARLLEELKYEPRYIKELTSLLEDYSIVGTIEEGEGSCDLKLGHKLLQDTYLHQGSITVSNLFQLAKQFTGSNNLDIPSIAKLLANNDFIKIFRTFLESNLSNKFNSACSQFNYVHSDPYEGIINTIQEQYQSKLTKELRILELIRDLGTNNKIDQLTRLVEEEKLFVEEENKRRIDKIVKKSKKSIDYFDPKEDLKNITISPIGIVHLFRQYFFEFDSFLGSPVDHVWLSPGSSVILVEEKTSHKLIEKTFEEFNESITETEEQSKVTDEFSEQIKSENNQDISLGASVDVNQSWTGGSMNASTNMDFNNVRNLSKEQAHKRMREQSYRVASKIRKSFKSTFKSVEEFTETSFKKYVLANKTEELINYELRRKMRQVGVQVQDIGSYLCWQTFVDEPGKELGLSNMIHIASPADLDSIPRVELAELPKQKSVEHMVSISFQQDFGDGRIKRHDDQRNKVTYVDGQEVDRNGDSYHAGAKIFAEQAITIIPPEENYDLKSLSLVSMNGNLGKVIIREAPTSLEFKSGKTTVYLKSVNFQGKTSMDITVKGIWTPNDDAMEEIREANKLETAAYNRKVAVAHEEAFFEKVKDRTNSASRIKERKFQDLREEERIIVYRKLIDSLIVSAYGENYNINERQHHVISEMINSIFDINKMLYYVAPDWWKPRKESVKQSWRGGKIKDLLVDWGGEKRDNNYLITEESEPAKLGSSLGWLMQLDGDNMRNAFLNAPWVKAVIPIRPGKEKDAIGWLEHIEGAGGLDADYKFGGDIPTDYSNENGNITIRSAIEYLADQVKEKHDNGKKLSKYPPISDDSTVNATPIDKVYEYGFYPLEGGFKAQTTEGYDVFDQWIEVVPTDQIVPVEVEYDPITGRMK